jgi:flagellar motor switch protein FliN
MTARTCDPAALPTLKRRRTRRAALLALDDFGETDLHLEVPLGSLELDVRELLELRVGSLLQLDRLTGDFLDVTVNGTLIARGEVRMHGEKFAVRLTEILGTATPDASGEEPRDEKRTTPD